MFVEKKNKYFIDIVRGKSKQKKILMEQTHNFTANS